MSSESPKAKPSKSACIASATISIYGVILQEKNFLFFFVESYESAVDALFYIKFTLLPSTKRSFYSDSASYALDDFAL